jgi:hypothetical protein
MRFKHSLLLSWVLISVSGMALAQAPATPPAETAPPAPGRAYNCAPTTPQDTTTGQSSEPLGDKLAKSDGVLCPPAGVDPQMRAPTPDSGNTPVIPPPGSPGGDMTVRPK